ncbi:MAG TPA: phosphodiester glycosidase family protein [Patescibacteria group bacterium]|nr:phosphodiester glycosidase family protein [Patescibacteria group bacterium]
MIISLRKITKKCCGRCLVGIIGLFLYGLLPVLLPTTAEAAGSVLKQARSSQSAERLRIVLDLETVPQYTVSMEENPYRLKVRMSSTANRSGLTIKTFQDPVVERLQLEQIEDDLEAVIDLKTNAVPQVFRLSNPERLVIDIIKNGMVASEQPVSDKTAKILAKGLQYRLWRSESEPLQAHILEIDPRAGYIIRPVLSNDSIAGLETLSSMANRSRALAAVNASYFDPDGTIIGLLKLDGRIVSTPYLSRAVLGYFPKGYFSIDRPDYDGWVELPDGQHVTIGGVNRERGADELILYNSGYGPATGTNVYGREWVIRNGQVVACQTGNSPLTTANQILSAHGTVMTALAGLKVGDHVLIHQSLGSEWDQTVHALGAGPLLVKNGEVFLTTGEEGFGSDVAGGRAPRTAIGLTEQGHLLLVVVDGRQSFSRGMTLAELAAFMKDLGAKDAMNLDGGGSSEMIVQGRIVNSPSDGRERRVGDALVVIPSAGQAN